MLDSLRNKLTEAITGEERESLRYGWVYIVALMIAATLSVVNYLTGYVMITWIMMVFALLCALDYLLCRVNERLSQLSAACFAVQTLFLFVIFIVAGMPEGFSAIWIILLPSCGMSIFKRRASIILNGFIFVIMLFFFWTAEGEEMLRYDYTTAFKIRFPILFLAVFIVSFILETISHRTLAVLGATRDRYLFLCNHDELTGLYNRRGLDDIVRDAVSDPEVKTMALAMIDIDGFREINDSCGHLKADRILKEAAALISSDTKLPVSRWGGEEFAIFSSDGTLTEKKLYTLCREFENHVFDRQGQKVRLTVSVGAALCDGKIEHEELFRQAERRLRAAKKGGRNNVKICYPGRGEVRK